ncbi:unnamed protein product [Rotaria sordida]|uniref:NAD(P)(+)--arginine ADP-ribosyltransferase n=1 Tax=Rotaria sordida TaxID=392033 RepID=A0A819J3H8_9BILA|nr:unnamed protein product [Rotaria sordida]
MIENYVLVWLDTNINLKDDYYNNTIKQLQSIANNIHVFNDADQSINFFNKIKNQKLLLIVSGNVGQEILLHIHNIPKLTAVFIFCHNQFKYESLKKRWPIVRGVFTDIVPLCESLRKVAHQCEEDSIGISLFSTNDLSSKSLDQVDQSFMYTQLIKEIFLELEYNDKSIDDIVTYSRDKYSDNHEELKKIEMFHTKYTTQSPIWWYTNECFIYYMLNWSLREQEFDVIIRMAFFICDLHRHIEKLHSEQSKSFQNKFTVYRGQSMTSENFEKLKQAQSGLISFNQFFSTSIDENVSLGFAEKTLNEQGSVGILFIIAVDPSISSAPFASINGISYYSTENEILFSMLTVFRISEIKPSSINNQLWYVNLASTSNNDKQLNVLIERIRIEIEGPSALYRLGSLMIKLGEFDKAEKVFRTLLYQRTTDELQKGNIYYQLGQINDNQRKPNKALKNYHDALTIYSKNLPVDHSNIATCYNNIGLVYDNINDHSEALKFYEKALKIYKKTLPDDHPNIASCCNSIGLIHNTKGDYPRALSFCKTAHEIFIKSLPSTHPLLALSYNNLGLVYTNMKQYSDAIASYKRAVEIGQLALPSRHPNLQVYKQNLESVIKRGKK